MDPCFTCLDTYCGSFFPSSRNFPDNLQYGKDNKESTVSTPKAKILIKITQIRLCCVQKTVEGLCDFYRIHNLTVKLKAYLKIHLSFFFPGTLWWVCGPSLGSYPACRVSSVDTIETQLISCSRKLEQISSSYKMLWFFLSDRFLSQATCHLRKKQVVHQKSLRRIHNMIYESSMFTNAASSNGPRCSASPRSSCFTQKLSLRCFCFRFIGPTATNFIELQISCSELLMMIGGFHRIAQENYCSTIEPSGIFQCLSSVVS